MRLTSRRQLVNRQGHARNRWKSPEPSLQHLSRSPNLATKQWILSPRVPCNPGPGRPIPWSAPVRRSRCPGPSRRRKIRDNVGAGQVGSRQARLGWQASVWFLSSMLPRAFRRFLHSRGRKRGRERKSKLKNAGKGCREGLRYSGSRCTRHPRPPSNDGMSRPEARGQRATAGSPEVLSLITLITTKQRSMKMLDDASAKINFDY